MSTCPACSLGFPRRLLYKQNRSFVTYWLHEAVPGSTHGIIGKSDIPERIATMIDLETAQQKALTYVYTLIPAQDEEPVVLLHNITEAEWVFGWNSKRWFETGDYIHRIFTRCISVDKMTGELREMPKRYLRDWRPSL
jgi:hypothetical protein